MDLLAAAVNAKAASTQQSLALAMVKQNAQANQAIADLISSAAGVSPSSSRGTQVDITA